MKRRWLVWSVSMLVMGTGTLGCQGALGGPLAFPVVDQKAAWGTQSDGGLDTTRLQVAMVDRAGLQYCGSSGQVQPFKAVLVIVSGGGQPVVPGTYRVGAGSSGPAAAFGLIESLDGGTSRTLALSLDGGVTVAACSSTRCSGTFEGLVLQPDGGTSGLSGAFDAPAIICD